MVVNEKNFGIKAKVRRKRAEINLPNITFHQWESWRIKLGKDVFDAWLTLYTLADRKTYPNHHVIQHWDYEGLAKKFCCGRTKAIEYIKTMYEYGLVEIHETKNEKGGPKNIFIWCDIPFYSDTQFCDIYRARSWKDRKTEGKRRALAMLVARENSSSENELVNEEENTSSNSELEQKTSSKNELDTSTDFELEKVPTFSSSSTDFELVNQFKICTINNYTNNNNLNDMRNEKKGAKKISIHQQKLEDDFKDIVSYYYKIIGIGKQELMLPYIRKWLQLYGKGLVKYMIDRLSEQKKVTSVIRWMETALENPKKYPPKITLEKTDTTEQKPKNMYDELLMS